MKSKEAIGKRVSSLYVRGEETDVNNQWVGADLVLNIPPVGRFLLRVTTKNHFIDEQIGRTLDELADLTPDEFINQTSTDELEERKPFVMNDEVLTDEIVTRKFADRIVEADLAASLWFEAESVDQV